MKRFSALFLLAASIPFTAYDVKAEYPPAESKWGYASFALNTNASFSDNGRNYSGDGMSASLMFYTPYLFETGIVWHNFGGGNGLNADTFALNVVQEQIVIPIWRRFGHEPIFYLKGGYGILALHDDAIKHQVAGGCWSWGGGARLPLPNHHRIFLFIETNQWNGPVTINTRAESAGVELRF